MRAEEDKMREWKELEIKLKVFLSTKLIALTAMAVFLALILTGVLPF